MDVHAIKPIVATMLLAISRLSLLANTADPPPTTSPAETWLSPVAMVASGDGQRLYLACATANQVAVFDLRGGKISQRFAMPATPTGLTLSVDGSRLVVTCAGPASRICVVDAVKGTTVQSIPSGHTSNSPIISPDGKTLYVCNRFNNDVAVIDLAAGKELARIEVLREPVSAALTPDGKLLLVANHLPTGRSDGDNNSAAVSVIDTQARQVIKTILLPNGCTLLREIRVSPDGKYACVAHGLARFHLPTTQVDRGWMNTNGLTIIDLLALKVLNTVLLDNVDSGAANPWAVAWIDEGRFLAVTHAGTHDLSYIDFPALLNKLKKLPSQPGPGSMPVYSSASMSVEDVPNDLAFLVGVRQRFKLIGNGPRSLAVVGKKIYVGNYFSDNLNVVDLEAAKPLATAIPLETTQGLSITRRGEMLFNDGTMCFQGWQSCASCHSSDARVDSMNWDLLNDGLGNPKNTKSLLLAHQTPPAMSLGVRETGEMAVRAGIRSILFMVRPEEDAVALDTWLKSLKPIPSPHLVNGQLSDAAKRGQQLFGSAKLGCATCHPPGLFTDLQHRDVGTTGKYDQPEDLFDTPSLVECWRTAPYLHDGSAATILDVLTTCNRKNQHGNTSNLTPEQIQDLVEYVLSL